MIVAGVAKQSASNRRVSSFPLWSNAGSSLCRKRVACRLRDACGNVTRSIVGDLSRITLHSGERTASLSARGHPRNLQSNVFYCISRERRTMTQPLDTNRLNFVIDFSRYEKCLFVREVRRRIANRISLD